MNLLYHFTARHLAPSIQANGLTRGFLPEIGADGAWTAIPGYVWLTRNPSFQAQTWGTESQRLPYDRNEIRFTVELSDFAANFAANWLDFCAEGSISRAAAGVLNAYGDPENWVVFRGIIHPKNLTAMDARP